MENSLEKKQRVNLLMDLYEDLLTEKQREYLDLYYHEDLSLSEISLIKNVSKNAVFDNLKKACLHLENYEEKLNLLEKHQKRLEIIDDLEKDIKEEHKNIDEHLQMLRDLQEVYMAFDSLSERLQSTLKKVSGQGQLTESNMEEHRLLLLAQ